MLCCFSLALLSYSAEICKGYTRLLVNLVYKLKFDLLDLQMILQIQLATVPLLKEITSFLAW